MSKKTIREPTLYTIEELETIRGIIRDDIDRFVTSPRRSEVVKMTILTSNLTTLLVHEGFTCTYHPSKRQYTQTIHVQIGEDYDIYSLRLSPFTIFLLNTPYQSIREVVSRLLDLRTKYQQAMIDRHNHYLLVGQCSLCHYSDEDAEHCGKGLERVLECNGYKERAHDN